MGAVGAGAAVALLAEGLCPCGVDALSLGPDAAAAPDPCRRALSRWPVWQCVVPSRATPKPQLPLSSLSGPWLSHPYSLSILCSWGAPADHAAAPPRLAL